MARTEQTERKQKQMKEETFFIIKGMLASGSTYEEIASKKKISIESIKLIDESKTHEECNSKYYSEKGKQKGKTETKTVDQAIIVTANAYMVDQFNEQKRILEKLTEQMSTLIEMLK